MQNSDTKPVRHGEELEIDVLEHFLRKEIVDLPDDELQIEQFGAGHSNLTYCLKIGNWEAVLRRPPHGPIAPKAHDMKREFEFLTELYPYFKIAPKPYLYCEDEKIVGSHFFVMERKKGIVLDTDFPLNIHPTKEINQSISEHMVDHLVQLHNIDYQSTKLGDMSQPIGFMERQVNGWISRYERSKTDEIKGIADLQNWLSNHLPTSLAPTIIHYDYKLNNAMFSEDLSEMIGLFDWEMSTVGDPLADLGAALSYWTESDDPDLIKYGLGKPSVTTMNGFFTRDEFIHKYSLKSGRDVSQVHYYLTFAYFKLAVICQQIYYRYKKGQTNDPRFSKLDVTINSIIQHANDISVKPF
ncbi:MULTISPECIES: phosphotransferase family protein [Bacillus]|uniref:phosphotransferase family protein n=1 Tax=Bacillus TaxID=1386 RepID=UPI0002F35ECC|nr:MULTISPECIES: phosphotransferase family protein [Bacillus]